MTQVIASKLFKFPDACLVRRKLFVSGRRVVLTNGCFDLLHAGHIFSLERAKEEGDSLWVALNSDSSVKTLKGDQRPIFNENIRAYMLSALAVVDGIFLFDGARLANEIMAFHPDVYVKSGDYDIASLDKEEHDALQEINAKIVFVPSLPNFSTTSIIDMLSNDKHEKY